MPIPVDRVIDHLLTSLLSPELQPREVGRVSEAIGKVACVYPSEWLFAVDQRLSSLQPSVNQTDTYRLLVHFSSCHPFPPTLSPSSTLLLSHIVDLSLNSLHSIDSNLRHAGSIALKSISCSHASVVVPKLLYSLRIYQPSTEVLRLIESVLVLPCLEESCRKNLLNFLTSLFSDPTSFRQELTGDLAKCVSAACVHYQSPTASPLQDQLDQLQLMTTLYDLTHSLCWKQTLLNSPQILAQIYKSVALLLAVLPTATCPATTLHSIQSGLIRLVVHTTSTEDLSVVLESIEILTENKLFLDTEETVNTVVPILIDIGVAIGCMPLVRGSGVGQVESRLLSLWSKMSALGSTFLLNKLSSNLVSAELLVTLSYLCAAIGSPGPEVVGVDVLKLSLCVDQVCSGVKKNFIETPFYSYAVFRVIQAATARYPSTFILTVPMIDLVVGWIRSERVTDVPSELKKYWFSKSTATAGSVAGCGGPSGVETRELARTTLAQVGKTTRCVDSLHALELRLLEVVSEFPTFGFEEILCVIVDIFPLSKTPPPFLLVWTYLRAAVFPNVLTLLPSVKRLYTHELVQEEVGVGEKFDLNADFSKFVKITHLSPQSIFSLLLSSKLIHAAPPDHFPAICSLCRALLPLLSPGEAGRLLLSAITRSTTSFLKSNVHVRPLGELVGAIATTSFAEYEEVLAELTEVASNTSLVRSLVPTILGGRNDNGTTETIAAIARSSMGYAVEHAAGIDETLREAVHAMLEACLVTLGSLEGSPDSILIVVTLESVAKLAKFIAKDEAVVGNKLVSACLPIVVFDDRSRSVPTVSLRAMAAVAAIAATASLSMSNFEKSIQYSVSALVHAISSFTTLDLSPYEARIEAVANLLGSVVAQSPTVGLSRLAKLLAVAGASSPLPILRVISLEVFQRVLLVVSGVIPPIGSAEWIECAVLVVPRLKDFTTQSRAEIVVKTLMGGSELSVENVLISPEQVKGELVVSVVKQLLHAGGDPNYESGKYVVSLVNSIIVNRGSEISPLEASGLISHMFGLADFQLAQLQGDVVGCIHSLTRIHLKSALKELVEDAVKSAGPPVVLTDSQLAAIGSIAKDRSMLIEFVSIMLDTMNNSPQRMHSVVAGECLNAAFCCGDSLVAVLARQLSPQLIATAFMHHHSHSAHGLLDRVVALATNTRPGGQTVAPLGLLGVYVDSVDEKRLAEIIDFLLPFLNRKELKDSAETLLCYLIGRCDRLEDVAVLERVKVGLMRNSPRGCLSFFTFRRSMFGVNELKIAVALMGESRDAGELSVCVELLVMCADVASKFEADIEWRNELLGCVGVLTHNVIESSVTDVTLEYSVLFERALALLSRLVEISNLMSQKADEVVAFKKTVTTETFLAVRIRSEFFSIHNPLLTRVLHQLEQVAGDRELTFAQFESTIQPLLLPRKQSRLQAYSPALDRIVLSGAAGISAEIANSTSVSPNERSRIIQTLLRCVSGGFECVIQAIGDLTLLSTKQVTTPRINSV